MAGNVSLGVAIMKEEVRSSIEDVEPESSKPRPGLAKAAEASMEKAQKPQPELETILTRQASSYCLQCMRCMTLTRHGSSILALTNLLGVRQAKPPKR